MLNPLEQVINDAYITEARFELAAQMRTHVLDWSNQFGERFFFATHSALKGAWDDVRNDLRKGRISRDEAGRLADKMLESKLINQRQYDWYSGQFNAITEAGQ